MYRHDHTGADSDASENLNNYLHSLNSRLNSTSHCRARGWALGHMMLSTISISRHMLILVIVNDQLTNINRNYMEYSHSYPTTTFFSFQSAQTANRDVVLTWISMQLLKSV